jgi:hypothetical protein
MKLVMSAIVALLCARSGGVQAQTPPRDPGAVLVSDDFERGLDAWRIHGDGARVRDSRDPAHGHVLELRPSGDVVALIKGSEAWRGTRLEGEMLFPTDIDNYLGFVFNVRERGARMDFGVVYVKGNDSYLQANPHRDFNVSRTLYPEARAAIAGRHTIKVGVWERFAMEVIGSTCHVYIGDAEVPQLTFPHFEFESGALGLQPRSVGGDVWVDNVIVRRISRFSYCGEAVPLVTYTPQALLTDWRVAGAFDRTHDEIARRPDAETRWAPFHVDRRGAVTTGTVIDFHGPRSVAYFRTTVVSPVAGPARFEISTVDDLALWVNGRFHWFIPRQDLAWFDFVQNRAHQGQSIPIDLRAGANDLVLRVRGGVYASGGFYARVSGPSAP